MTKLLTICIVLSTPGIVFARCHEECRHWDTVNGEQVCTEWQEVCDPDKGEHPDIKPTRDGKGGGGVRE